MRGSHERDYPRTWDILIRKLWAYFEAGTLREKMNEPYHGLAMTPKGS
jgi:hypothetical protein